jgi:CubicO group peptidase (beta-lactamase class C family)
MKNQIRNSIYFMTILWTTLSCEDDTFPKSDNPPPFPTNGWQQVENIENFGWNADRLESAERFSITSGTQSVMIIDNGRLIESWGDTDKKFYVASIRKSYLSMLYGYYINTNISLDATLNDYAIDDINPTLNSQEKSAKVKDLLSSSSGVYHKSTDSSDNENLPPRNSTFPGQTFYYNNWDFNALGTIFEQQTGKKIHQVFSDKIGSKIGLQDFNWQTDGRYNSSSNSIHRSYPFDMTTRDMARIGLLMLKKGNWNGEQIIDESWINTITTRKVEVPQADGGGGYGYMWWVNDGGRFSTYGNIPADAFSAQGNQSQIILVVPSKNVVIVHRGRFNMDGNRVLMILKMILDAK